MKKITMLVILMLPLLLLGESSVQKELYRLKSYSDNQYRLLSLAYNKCKEYDLQYSCMAIMMQESDVGTYVLNLDSNDFGVMQINLKNYYELLGIDSHKLNYWQKNKIISRLIRDDSYNIDIAIITLSYFRKVYGNNYMKIWGSYRGGYNPDYNYAKSIRDKIIALKIFIRLYPDKIKIKP